MSAYTNFKAEWNGRRVDYDHVYGYQCVDLILQYVKECYGLATGVSGNAIDYWYRTSPVLLTKFDRVQTTSLQENDIVILNGLTGNPYGHILVYGDSQTATTFKGLEQNATGSGDGLGESAIGVWRDIAKSRIVGVLRPKGSTPAPTGGTAKVLREAYVRSAPSLSAPLAGSQVLEPGDTFIYVNKVPGTSVSGNNIWYQSQFNHYVWSGNCSG